MISSILDPVLGFMLKLNPLVAIVIISFAVAMLMNIIYKFMTNQPLLKNMKEQLKNIQKQIKANPSKAVELQKKALSLNMKYMGHTMKPTIITFIPLILLLGWLGAHFSFDPIEPGEQFEITLVGNVSHAKITVPQNIKLLSNATLEPKDGVFRWQLKALKEGNYIIDFTVENKTYSKELIISTEQRYAPPTKEFDKFSITVGYEKLTLLNIFGLKIGWLGTYIIFALIFSMLTKKMLRLY